MKATLGGIMIPSVPPDAVAPRARRRSYPLLHIWGTATDPMVAAVTGLEPHTAPNAAQAKIVLTASEPGNQFSHFWAAENRSSPRRKSTISATAVTVKSRAPRGPTA